jgi:NAD(P)-dependent dehydrogenase (short-subunit alcohol dehydrogenase family)
MRSHRWSNKSKNHHFSFMDNQGRHRKLAADLATVAGRESLFAWLDREIPDVIVQCLGGKASEVENRDPWLASMELNFHSVVAIDEYLIPRLLGRGHGTIVHISSSAAAHGRAFTPYACAKAALNRYIVNRGRECLSKGIIVCGIMPAAVQGDDNQWALAAAQGRKEHREMCRGQFLGRAQTTDEVAESVLMLCGPAGKLFGGCVLPADAAIGG